MRSNLGNEIRTSFTAGAFLLALAILVAPAAPAFAQDASETSAVVTQLEGIRVELKSISHLLQTLEKHQQVTLLMTRIRLKQQRLSLLESQLREARGEQKDLKIEIEQIETVEQSYLESIKREEYGSHSAEVMEGELQFLRTQRGNAEARLQAQRAAVIDLENDLMGAREDVLALEETVDEQLGLR